MVLRMKTLIFWGFTEKFNFYSGRGRGGGSRKTNIEGGCLKREVWTVCWFKMGARQERGGGVFEEGGLTPQCPLWTDALISTSVVPALLAL